MRTVHVVVQTHWDREWYLPRVTTLARAQQVLSRVCAQLDDGRLPSFLFDGQTVAFVDLLAVAEHDLAEALQRHARSGRLALGPWFVMADEFLVSGESLLRNLELGHADAARLGAVQRTGYLPDSFGHVAQMPEILRQFGIDTAVLWRGADAAANTFDWQAPSGAVAGTVFLPEGYYQHPLNLPEAASALPPLLEKIAARTPAGPLLLTQGGDHLAPAEALAARLSAFNAAQADWRLEFATLPQHVGAALAATPARERISGELRRNRRAFVLPDVLSTRRYLKRLHQQAEDRLLGEIEPLLALCWPRDRPWPQRALERCWRLLVEQQAHDSICGCSIDAVHAEMEQRFVQLVQEFDALRAATLEAAGAVPALRHDVAGDVFADDRTFTLLNPLPRTRAGHWLVTLFVRGEAPRVPQVFGEDGVVWPTERVGCEPHAELISPLDDFPDRMAGHRLQLRVTGALPPLGVVRLRLRDGEAPGDAAAPRRAVEAIDNGRWRAELDGDGQLIVTDLALGRRSALALCSELDAGDSYNFSPPARPQRTIARRWQRLDGWRGAQVQELRLTIELRSPAGLDGERLGASTATVDNTGTLVLQLCGDSPDLHATLDWHNRAQDQRTRLLLPFPPSEGDHTGADSAFAWIERPVAMAEIPDVPSRQEMPPVVMPSLSAIAAGHWALAHEAMQEFEVMQIDGERVLGWTLVRSVGWLSRRDLRTRGVGAGPDLATPDAQCLRSERYRFVLRSMAPGESARDAALAAAADLRRPPVVLRGHVPPRVAPIDLGNDVVQVSAVRRVADTLELRLWNPTDRAQTLAIDAAHWQPVFADGCPASGPADGVPPCGLLTLRERA